MSASREEQLKGFLSQLPAGAIGKLSAALERDRLSGHGELPHETLLSGLRPALSTMARVPDRVPTPLRLFCKPFEDLIYPGHRNAKQEGRIARSSILPVWDWLGTDLLGEELAGLCGKLTQYILTDDSKSMRDVLIELRGKASSAIEAQFEGLKPGSDPYKALAERLGGEMILQDAHDMSRVLAIADDITGLQDALPRPIEILSEKEIARIQKAYEVMSSNSPEHAPYIIYVALGRMRRPWEILRVLGRLTKRDTDFLASKTELGQCGNLLFCDMENAAAFFAQIDVKQTPMDVVRQQLDFFVNISHGVTHEMGIRRDGEWGQRLVAARSQVANKMEALLPKFAKEVSAVLPFRKGSEPDLNKTQTPETDSRALEIANFLDEIRHLAPAGAFSKSYSKVVEDLTDHVERYSNAIIDQLRHASSDNRAAVEARVQAALEICSRLLGPTETDTMERRVNLARKEAS